VEGDRIWRALWVRVIVAEVCCTSLATERVVTSQRREMGRIRREGSCPRAAYHTVCSGQ
jgi:hypothetical protein